MLAQTPPMGWNTWNTFGSNINEKIVLENVDAFVRLGLPDAGYRYIVIDDCWSCHERDPKTGKIVPDPVKFPHGMKYVSDYVHDKGLKFGMYSCAGVRTCAGYPGSFDHEFLDAETFAEYGCDLLKYDSCFRPTSSNGPLLYRRMGMALKACGREILYSACNCGRDEIPQWARSAGVHMYRTTHDIHDYYEFIKRIAQSQMDHLAESAPGCFNDLDMLTVGMFSSGPSDLAAAEYRLEFALWCMFSSPLMLGCDVRKISPEMLALVTNKNLLRIGQDPEARPPMVACTAPGDQKYAMLKHLSGGELALGFFNMEDQPSGVHALLEDFGISASSGLALSLTDAFTGEPFGVCRDYVYFEIPAHDCRVFLAKIVKV